MELTGTQSFEVKKEQKVGHMRCDFADGNLANSWFPTELSQTENLDLSDVQEVVNEIMFEKITSYDKVIELCAGEGLGHTTNLFGTKGTFNYWVQLIPVKGEYNYYIHVYVKGNE